MCEFCEKHKPLLTYHYDSIHTEIKLINKTQLDAMTTVTDQRGATTSVGQSNRQLLSNMWTTAKIAI